MLKNEIILLAQKKFVYLHLEHYGDELDNTHTCRTLRGWFLFLSGQDEGTCRPALLGVDGGLCLLLCPERRAAGQGCRDDTHRHRLPRVDGHRCTRRRAAGHLCLPRTSHLLATLLHLHPRGLYHRIENGINTLAL